MGFNSGFKGLKITKKIIRFSCISKVEIISGLLADLHLEHQGSDIKTLTMETDSVPGTMAY